MTRSIVVILGTALIAVAGVCLLSARIVAEECQHQEPTHIVGSDENGPASAVPSPCFHDTTPPTPATTTIIDDNTGAEIIVPVTKVCPEYIWTTPDHWSHCDDEDQLHTAECKCCRLKTYVKQKWTVKCIMTGDDASTPTCVKDREAIGNDSREEFTRGDQVTCPTVEGGGCPNCP